MPGWDTAIAVGADLLGGFFGDDAADEAAKRAREAAEARAAAADEAGKTFANWYGQAQTLNQPGLNAYGTSVNLLTDLLSGRGVSTPVYAGQETQMGNLTKSLSGWQKQLQAIDAQMKLPSSQTPAEVARLTAARKNTLAKIAEVQAAQKKATAAMADLKKSGKAKMTTEDWLRKADPGYDIRFKRGQDALTGVQSSRKDRLGGRAVKEQTRYGQDYASNEFDNSVRRLMSLAGIGDAATGRMTATGGNVASGTANAIMSAADARATGMEDAASADMWSASNWINQLGSAGATIYDRYRRSMPNYSYSMGGGGYAGVGSPAYTGA